tara:strand:- start:4542 stop:6074 length:1533 start_codon:yes stop_codon:yes gene_type:complete
MVFSRDAVRRLSAATQYSFYMIGIALLSSCGDVAFSSTSQDSVVSGQDDREPLNVLFILTDDQAWDTVAALGNRQISTPTIDSLVDQGMTFTHVFNQGAWSGAVCLPSRQMINTGRHLYRTGLDARGVNDKQFVQQYPVFGETFLKNGYNTFQTGKWHLSMDVWKRSFNHGTAIHKNGMSRHEDGGQWAADFTDYDASVADDAAFKDYKGDKHSSEVIADAAVSFINQQAAADRPFMMYVAFLAPHDPRQAPQQYLDKYPPESIELPDNYLPYHPFDQGDYYLRDEVLVGFPRSSKVVKENIAEYYAMIEHMDAQIARILDALEQSDKADNTLIVFTSDHGLAVGKHGLMGKQNQYDHSVRVPFVIAGPNIPTDTSAPGMFYLNSVFPTAAELAGIETPKSVDAPSIGPLIRGEKKIVYDTVYGAYRHFQRMLRSQNFKLIYYPMIGKTQLFDLRSDPLELNDLAAMPEQAERIAEMMAQLAQWQEVVEDPLDFNAPEESYQDFLKLTWD